MLIYAAWILTYYDWNRDFDMRLYIVRVLYTLSVPNN